MRLIVKISKQVETHLYDLCIISKIEQCGIFIGEFQQNSIVIDKIIQDKSLDDKTRFSSIRHTKAIYPDYKNFINEIQIFDYIGEWHTHPVGSSIPSWRDNRAMKALLNEPKYSSPQKLILGIISNAERLRIYMYEYRIKKIIELKIELILI